MPTAPMTAMLATGSRPTVAAPAPTSEAMTPPTEKVAWKPDMTGRPYAFSTCTACAFMLTSRQPLQNPKTSRAPASVHGSWARPGSTRAAPHSTPPVGTTMRAPKRSVSGPAICIPAKAPSPSSTSSPPSVAWLMPTRSSTAGICTTQAPIRVPHRTK